MNRRWRISVTVLAIACGVLLLTKLQRERSVKTSPPLEIAGPTTAPSESVAPATTVSTPTSATMPAPASGANAHLLAQLERLFNRRDARPQEGLLTFKDDAAYQWFLARARQAGLTVLGQIDRLRTARVRYDAIAHLQRDLQANPDDYAEITPNFLINIPTTPAKEARDTINQIPFGNRALGFLGVTEEHSQWGRGTTIAILDSGVAPDTTFGEGRLRTLDIGFGTAPGTASESGHGTSVAALAAGAAPDAPGLAPAANLLSVRVTDANGTSDAFTVSRAILAAVDHGAKIINVSLGGYGTTNTLDAAIGYAVAHGAVIVAAAGNDQAAQLTWPAADPRVVSVGAVDASGQQVLFSNSGPQLQVMAPGYGVQSAWLDGQRVTVNGTSASAPIVSGAIAAMMSENPGYTAPQAWQALQQTVNDSGAPGADANYGSGILNVGWAMNRNNPAYIDTAIASHYYDGAKQEMDFVVQNRSGGGIGGLQLSVTIDGNSTNHTVPMLAAGASTVIKVPVNQTAVKTKGTLTFVTQLVNPGGTIDRVPANNQKSSVLAPLKK